MIQAKKAAESAQQRADALAQESIEKLKAYAETTKELLERESKIREELTANIDNIKKQQNFKALGASAQLCTSQEEAVIKCYQAVEASKKGPAGYLGCHDLVMAYRDCAAQATQTSWQT